MSGIADFQKKYENNEPIVMLTAYDYPTARAAAQAGIDVIFVGDSLGTNVLGYESSREVTMDDMVHHLRAVCRGIRADTAATGVQHFVLADLPCGSYDTPELALSNARRFMDNGADGVKLEGAIIPAVEAIVADGIPICGHIGYLPQTDSQAVVKGKEREAAQQLLADAEDLDRAGVFMLVCELIPERLAAIISKRVKTITIGIGAGVETNGQVQVLNDILGITPFSVRHADAYADIKTETIQAMQQYADVVRSRQFPRAQHTSRMDDTIITELS